MHVSFDKGQQDSAARCRSPNTCTHLGPAAAAAGAASAAAAAPLPRARAPLPRLYGTRRSLRGGWGALLRILQALLPF